MSTDIANPDVTVEVNNPAPTPTADDFMRMMQYLSEMAVAIRTVRKWMCALTVVIVRWMFLMILNNAMMSVRAMKETMLVQKQLVKASAVHA